MLDREKKGKSLVSLSIATGEDIISEESVTGKIVGYENSDLETGTYI